MEPAIYTLEQINSVLGDLDPVQAVQALLEFAEQADMTFIFSFDETQGLTAGKLEGWYTRTEALLFVKIGHPSVG